MTRHFLSRRSLSIAVFALSVFYCGVSASADTLRCQSINGNLNCAGSNGVACQTVDGKKVCTSGHGDVVQSFGGHVPSDDDTHVDDEDVPADPAIHERLQQHDTRGRTMLLQRDGAKLHLRSDWLSIDRD